MRTLIVCGGVVGTSIAYHLAAKGADVIVIERSAIACAASGKSGLASWRWTGATGLLSRISHAGALRCTSSLRTNMPANGVTAA